MSIFKSILAKLVPSNHPAVASPGSAGVAPASPAAPGAAMSAPVASAPAASAPAVAMAEVDVAQILNELAATNDEKLNWRSSIVDLMKLLSLDSSLASRKSLAAELGYAQDTSDSAAMNIWLHRQVMTKLAQNGGKVPAELKD